MAKYKYHERNDGTLGRCRAGEGRNRKAAPFVSLMLTMCSLIPLPRHVRSRKKDSAPQ